MDKRTYYLLVSAIFAVVTLLHGLRIYYGWEAQIGDLIIPMWASWAALLIAGYLAIRGWQFSGNFAKHRR